VNATVSPSGDATSGHESSTLRRRPRRSGTLVLLSIWALVVVAGILMAFAAHVGGPLPGDVFVTRELQEPSLLTMMLMPLMLVVSAFGYFPWAELTFAIVVGALLLRARWSASLLIALTTTGDALAAAVKLLVARPRPDENVVEVYQQLSSYSYPSGHVVHYVVFFGGIAYLAWGALRSDPAPGAWRRVGLMAVLATSIGLILLVGVSRVYLGEHWTTDVLGGYLIGGAWLMLLVAAYRRWGTPPGQRKPAERCGAPV
jgi:membrane-associated phospholipid phosphatase